MNKFPCFFIANIKQVDSVLPWVCSVIDHRRCQNVAAASVTHSPNGSYFRFLLLPHFVFIYDLLLNRCMMPWTLSKVDTRNTLSSGSSCPLQSIVTERMYLTSWQSYQCSKTMKQQPYWCSKTILWGSCGSLTLFLCKHFPLFQ